jgi:translation elongation factor TU
MTLNIMSVPFMRIVVVGHIDHGKSTLIGRLLHDSGSLADGRVEEIARASRASEPEWAFLMDHLSEEREREMTIDSAQAFFTTPARAYRIIDAPGHKEFLRNMVTGAAQADAAVLVIDVEAGILEQTRRHAAMLAMLGRREVILVINKMDCVDGRREAFEAASGPAVELLRTMKLRARCVIPISAKQGWNLAARPDALAWYEGPTVFEALDAIPQPEPPSDRPLRLPVQNTYWIGGRSLALGRIESGRIETGQEVMILPHQGYARVQSVERFLETRTSAEAGESIGLVLERKVELSRGIVVCDPESPAPVVERFEANVFWLSDEPWRAGDRLVLRCTTQEVECRIQKVKRRINSSTLDVIETNAALLAATEVGDVVIRLSEPVALEVFDSERPLGRFVLMKNGAISAGGTVSHIAKKDCLRF